MHWGYFKAIYLLVFVFIIYFIANLIKKRKKISLFSRYKYLRKMDNVKPVVLNWRNLLIVLSLIFLIIALMKPQWGVKEREMDIKGADIIFAVDVSNSMLAKDILPSRLDRAKKGLAKLMDEFSGNFVALIAFAGESKIIVPLTFDYKYLKYSLLSLDTNSVDIQGTNFRELLEKTSLIFKKTKKKRFLIILTDGEDNEGRIEEALKTAKESNIKIYTIGVGTLKGERIPEYDSSGKFIGFKKDKNGNYVFSRINPDILRKLGEETGGNFCFNNDVYKCLKTAINDIRQYKSNSSIKVSIVQYNEKYYYFAFLSFLFLFIGFSLPIGNKNKIKILIFILLTSFLNGYSIIDRGNHHNNKGIKYYKKKRYKKSLQEFQKAKDYTLYDKKLDFNIADALYKTGKYEEALNYYKNCINNSKKDLRKSTYFNMGNAYYKMKRYKDALDSYKNALKIDPDFKKAKKNLELTLKKIKKKNGKNNQNNKGKQDNKNKQNNQNKQDNQENKDKQNNQNRNMNNINSQNKKKDNQDKNRKMLNKKKNIEKTLLENLLNNLKKKESKKRKKLKKLKKRRVKSNEKDW